MKGLFRSVQSQSIFARPHLLGGRFCLSVLVNDRLLLVKCSSDPFGNKRNARRSTLDPLHRARGTYRASGERKRRKRAPRRLASSNLVHFSLTKCALTPTQLTPSGFVALCYPATLHRRHWPTALAVITSGSSESCDLLTPRIPRR